MAIIFQEEKKKYLHFTQKQTTYQFKVDCYGFLIHLYYGKKIQGEMDYLHFADRGFSPATLMIPDLTGLILWMRCPRSTCVWETVITEEKCSGSPERERDIQLRSSIKDTKLWMGNMLFPGLPAEICLEDPVTKIRAVLLYLRPSGRRYY